MITYNNLRNTKYNLNRIYFGKNQIGEIYFQGEKIWPIGTWGDMILSCFFNGYWIDEYPWTDETSWTD